MIYETCYYYYCPPFQSVYSNDLLSTVLGLGILLVNSDPVRTWHGFNVPTDLELDIEIYILYHNEFSNYT